MRSKPVARLVLASALIFLLGGVVGSFGVAPPAIAQPAANDRLGICHVNLMALDTTDEILDERYQRAVEAGAGWTRYEIRWDEIESSAGFDYAKQDNIVRRDVANGLKVDAIFNATPASYATSGLAWVPGPRVGQRAFTSAQLAGLAAATSAPANLYEPIFADGTDTPAPGKAINPDNYWARFVRKTVERYMPGGTLATDEGWPDGAGIRLWEIWNEPDRAFWTGTVEDYYRLLKVAYLVIESTDQEATVMLAGLAHWPDPNWPPSVDWFPNFLNTVASDPLPAMRDAYNQYFDAAAWHWYSNPRHLYEKTVEMRSLMADYGITGKSIWVNESGVSIWDEYPGPTEDPDSPGRATTEEQAAWVLQGFAEGFAADVERIFFFQLYDDCGNGPFSWDAYGLIRNPEGSAGEGVCAPHPDSPGVPRPAYTAYQVAAQEFRDVEPTWRYHDYASGLGRVALFRPPDERVLVMWNWSFADKTFNIIATGDSGELIDVAGASQAVTPAGGSYAIPLPAATNDNWDQAGAMIGGQPYILVETDTLTPTARVDPLSETSSPTFQVAWDLQDWGTGIAAYEIWYSDGAPASPADWQLLTEDTAVSPVKARLQDSVSFAGQAGHTYYFAARAQDRAGNWSALGEPQAWTTIMENGVVAGRVFDIRRQPVASATVEVVLEAGVVATGTTDVDGQFVVQDVPFGQEYGVSATAEGYGSWPPVWKVTPTSTATPGVELDLPPFFNALVNGGFEDGYLAGWVRGGNTLPLRSNFGRTGADRDRPKAALLGFRSDGAAPGDSTLSQMVDVSGESPALGFWYRVYQTSKVGEPPPNLFQVLLATGEGGDPRVLYTDRLSASEAWQYQWVDLGAFAGQEVKITFKLTQPAADLQTVVYLDNVALGPAVPRARPLHGVLLPLLMRN
ncbi:MAG: carboxypeptidase regulatory-like domain-containing protein [Anaerolineae bacterium]